MPNIQRATDTARMHASERDRENRDLQLVKLNQESGHVRLRRTCAGSKVRATKAGAYIVIQSRDLRLETLAVANVVHELLELRALFKRRAGHDLPVVEYLRDG